MVYVPAGSFALDSNVDEVDLPAYWIDKYEVTNRAYKEFIDRCGNREQRFWREPFVSKGHTLAWSEAMNEFRTRPGAWGRPHGSWACTPMARTTGQ